MGTFAVMALLGFSINMVTLFGMVLAIGIVVDDAIVVVENVERNMTTLMLGPKEASNPGDGRSDGPDYRDYSGIDGGVCAGFFHGRDNW